MKLSIPSATAAVAFSALPLFALAHGASTQEPAQAREPVQLQEPVQQDEAPRLFRVDARAGFDAADWRERLIDPDLDRRERAFDELLDEARRNRAAEDSLREWTEGADELSWTARLALRELDRSGGPMRPGTSATPFDPFGSGSPQGAQPFGGGVHGGDPFEQMRARMEQMLEEFHGGDPFRFDSPFDEDFFRTPPGAMNESRTQSFQLRTTPDGVEVEILEDDGQGPTTKTYSAESVEELLELYPELEGQIGGQIGGLDGGGLRLGPFAGSGDIDDLLERLRGPGAQRGLRPAPGADLEGDPRVERLRKVSTDVERTDILGVYMREPDPVAARANPELGLEVQSVLPGSLAAALRVQPGDVLLELNGVRLSSADDVKRALVDRASDAEVRLRVRDRRGEEETLLWSPVAER